MDTTVDRVRSKSKEDKNFAPKQNERDCPMTKLSQGKGFYPVLGQKFQPVKNLNSRK